mmetsp:Transcript_25786/g.64524  ORF Transcript_25786/g.64524 Transcript_25786/m.64524 type:complete len:237 (-) Transcript_25786:2676-3386(-)
MGARPHLPGPMRVVRCRGPDVRRVHRGGACHGLPHPEPVVVIVPHQELLPGVHISNSDIEKKRSTSNCDLHERHVSFHAWSGDARAAVKVVTPILGGSNVCGLACRTHHTSDFLDIGCYPCFPISLLAAIVCPCASWLLRRVPRELERVESEIVNGGKDVGVSNAISYGFRARQGDVSRRGPSAHLLEGRHVLEPVRHGVVSELHLMWVTKMWVTKCGLPQRMFRPRPHPAPMWSK